MKKARRPKQTQHTLTMIAYRSKQASQNPKRNTSLDTAQKILDHKPEALGSHKRFAPSARNLDIQTINVGLDTNQNYTTISNIPKT